MKKVVPIIIVIAVLVGAGSFYGGMKYAGSKKSAARGERFGQMDGGMAGRMNTNRGGGAGFVNGEIISKDDKSITVKLRDGGSRIVFYSDSTEVGKFVDGAPADLEVGKNVMVNGKVNPDGSLAAQSIQIRPALSAGGPTSPNQPLGQ